MDATSVAKAEQAWLFKMKVPVEPGIVCIDLERMLKFYTEVLGLKLLSDAQTLPEMSTKFGASPHGYRIVRMQTPDGGKIKLAQPTKSPAVQNPIPEWVFERPGIAYFTFIVEDIKPVLARLKANHVKLVSEEPVEVRKGVFAQFLIDPEGNFVEFVELPEAK